MKLTSLTCPKCGASAEDAVLGQPHTCTFCGEASVVERPASVVQQTIVQREVVRRVVTVDPTTGVTSLPCPRCDVALFEGEAAWSKLHGCGTCGGVWLDNALSMRVVHAVQTAVVSVSDRVSRAKKIDVEAAAQARCPLDRETLKRVTVCGVDLDVCATHGTWFDAGEVRRVATAFQEARLAAVGGPTHDYRPAAEEALRNQRYGEAAASLIGAILGGVALAAVGVNDRERR